MAETRPSSAGGVTVWRSVVVLITHRIGPAPMRKKLAPASSADGSQIVSTIRRAAVRPASGPMAMTVPNGSARLMRPASSAPATMPRP